MPDTETRNKTQLPTMQDTKSLADAFALVSRYGDEYMDETPLAGEPGSFIFSKPGDTNAGGTTATATTGNINTGSTPTPTPEGDKLKRRREKART